MCSQNKHVICELRIVGSEDAGWLNPFLSIPGPWESNPDAERSSPPQGRRRPLRERGHYVNYESISSLAAICHSNEQKEGVTISPLPSSSKTETAPFDRTAKGENSDSN